MFLDDQLYEWVKLKDIKKPDDFIELRHKLFQFCEEYYKAKLKIYTSYEEITQILDKTFKLWDLFIIKLEKENWFLIDILKEYSYKKMFMNNSKLKEIYDKGVRK